MNDLIAFLRARLNEDAAAARVATSGPWWHNPGKQWLEGEAFESYDLSKGQEFVGYGGPHPFTGAVASTGPASHMQSMKDAAHIARHHPVRVLAEVDAKRRIVAAYENYDIDAPELDVPESVLRMLALPYGDHPDYRDEWRP